MLTQKLYRNGNAVAVTIPKEILRELNLRDGSEVDVGRDGQKFVAIPKKKKALVDVDVKFARMVEEFIDDHEDVLKQLAKR